MPFLLSKQEGTVWAKKPSHAAVPLRIRGSLGASVIYLLGLYLFIHSLGSVPLIKETKKKFLRY
jgi:hypothetical protein